MSEQMLEDPIGYAQRATKWGWGEGQKEPADTRSVGQKAADRHREVLAWLKRASTEDLQQLADTGEHEGLQAACTSELDTWDMIAATRSAQGALRSQQGAREQQAIEQVADAQDGAWGRMSEPLEGYEAAALMANKLEARGYVTMMDSLGDGRMVLWARKGT